MISFKKALLCSAAFVALGMVSPAFAVDDQSAPEGHAQAPIEEHRQLQLEDGLEPAAEVHTEIKAKVEAVVDSTAEQYAAPDGKLVATKKETVVEGVKAEITEDVTGIVAQPETASVDAVVDGAPVTTSAAPVPSELVAPVAVAPEAVSDAKPVSDALCHTGKSQSPVNIAEYQPEALAKLKVAYAPTKLNVVNNGEAVGVRYEPGSKFMSDEKIYDLLGLSFRSPSEHYVNGAPYPMEMQLMHRAEDGAIAALSVLIKLGNAPNATIQSILDNVPPSGGETIREDITLDMATLLPVEGNYYSYTGSLTQAPCAEGVKWHVLKQPIEISLEQLRGFQTLYPYNARGIQPLNGRVVSGTQSGS